MTLGDVTDRILTTPHDKVFVCLASLRRNSATWFASQFRECLDARDASIISTSGHTQLAVSGPRGRVIVRLTCQDEMVSNPFLFKGYIRTTPIFTEYRGGWAESTIE